MTFVLASLLFLALLVAPGGYESPVGGAVLTGPAQALFVLGVLGVAFCCVFRPARRVRAAVLVALAALLAAKCVIGALDTPIGWKGRYEMTDTVPAATGTFFWRFAAHDFRIDRDIDFDGPRFGLHFLNDPVRYGGLYSGLRDGYVPMRITWEGAIKLPVAQRMVSFVRVRGRVVMSVDGRPVLEARDQIITTLPVTAAGWHRITVTYEKPAHQPPLISVLLSDQHRFRLLDVLPETDPARRETQRAVLAAFTTVIVGAGCLILILAGRDAFGLVSPRRIVARRGRLATAWAAFFVCSVLVGLAWQSCQPYTGMTVQLSAGDDPLIYEGNARDVMANGLMMLEGRPVGHGRPYYFYPLYSYVLAGAHWIMGEDFSTVVLFNGLCIAALPLLLWAFAWRHLPGGAAWAAMLVLGAFCYWRVWYYTLTAFTDPLFIMLTFAALCAVRAALQSGRAGTAIGAGALSALAAATRPSFMTFVPLLAAAVVAGLTTVSRQARLRLAILVLLGFGLGLSPFALRNYLMSGQLVLLVNSWIQLPYFLTPPERPNPVGGVPTFTQAVAWAGSIVRADPVGAARIEARKLLFTLGATEFGPAGVGKHPEFLLITVLGALALVLRRGPPVVRSAVLVYAVSHTVAMMLAAPWTYGFKSILPLQIAWLGVAAFLVAAPVDADSQDLGASGT